MAAFRLETWFSAAFSVIKTNDGPGAGSLQLHRTGGKMENEGNPFVYTTPKKQLDELSTTGVTEFFFFLIK